MAKLLELNLSYNFFLKLIPGDPRPFEGQAQEERAHQGVPFITNCPKKLDRSKFDV